MVRYVKNEGRPALGFAVESEESDESSDDEPLSDQPSLATLVSENPGSPPDSQAPFVPKASDAGRRLEFHSRRTWPSWTGKATRATPRIWMGSK